MKSYRLMTFKQDTYSMVIIFNYLPVISGDTSSTCPCGLFVLFIVVGVDVGFLGLLLQDLSKLVFADATKERSYLMGFLDHPLQTARAADVRCYTKIVQDINVMTEDDGDEFVM